MRPYTLGFDVLCIVLASYMTWKQVYTYFENDDFSEISFKRFEDGSAYNYPTFTICLEDNNLQQIYKTSHVKTKQCCPEDVLSKSAICPHGCRARKDNNKFMGNLVDRGIFGKAKCDFGRKDLCEGQNKEEVEVTVAVEPPKKPKLSEDERSDKDKMRQQLRQLQEAMHEKQSVVVAKSHNPEDHLGAVTTKRCHHRRPVNWVVTLHQEAKKEALRLAYMEIKTDIHSPRPRCKREAVLT